MNFLTEFLHMKAPKSGKEMPAYYRKALCTTAVLLIVYFLASFLLFGLACDSWQIVPLIGAAAMGLMLPNIKHMGPRTAGLTETFVVEGWCLWSVHTFGWGVSTQQFLVVPLVLSFFNVSEKPPLKILFAITIMAFRMVLFIHSTHHVETYTLVGEARISFQFFNTMFFYSTLALLCMLFSSSVQSAERQLRLDNQELHKEAGTDPLTQLPNRRAMMDQINAYLKKSPDQPFGVAIADIDFFKNVNDTYGHNCGDYTLRVLSDKFREICGENIFVCRWGGEEFCFFLPGKNLDEAGTKMNDLCIAVSTMPLSFDGQDFSITITIGVEDYDFRSPIDQVLERADQKLYMGKNSGRNQTVV